MDDILLTRNDMADLADNIESLQNNLKQITVENQILSLKLDEQIDRNMRETLFIHGVPGAENSWENTKNKLSAFILELSNHKLKCDEIYNAIVRAHRDGKDNKSIFVKVNNNAMVDVIKSLRFKNQNVYINQMRSPLVSARIKNGVNLRKQLKNHEGRQWNIFVNEKVQLMVKKPGEDKYSVYKQF